MDNPHDSEEESDEGELLVGTSMTASLEETAGWEMLDE